MARIKVTGYINVDDLEDEHVDLSHETGLSAAGYDYVMGLTEQPGYDVKDLDEVEFEKED